MELSFLTVLFYCSINRIAVEVLRTAMYIKTVSSVFLFVFISLAFVSSLACGSPHEDAKAANATEVDASAASQPAETAKEEPLEPVDETALERLRTEKWKGDIQGLLERRYIRALVLYNKTNFFYDGPQPRGITYEVLKNFEKFLNTKLDTGDKPVHIVFIPLTRPEIVKRMSEGGGDLAASNFAITPEMQQLVDFSDPLRGDASEVVVTGPSSQPISSINDLAGKVVFVRKLSRYWPNLDRLNAEFRKSGKPPMVLKPADDNLDDEDILNLVNSGVVDITVADDLVANFWAKVYDNINVHNDITLATDDKIAWAVQKGTPEFLALINEFVSQNKIGTTQGNVLLQKYLKDTKWATNNLAPAEMERFRPAAEHFRKYGVIYDFDWLMIAAQAYQESQIDQSRRSPAGAVGVMQIKPSTAADKPLFITDVDTNMDHNIKAGAGYMDYILKTNFKDAKLNKINRSLFALAAYNAGPARVAGLRKKAEQEGLDPNVWFNNVEIIAAREIGRETVTYVSNIYKYYIGYKMAIEATAARKRSMG
jgi:membrane-bound lytic murein transglycosylase MltF